MTAIAVGYFIFGLALGIFVGIVVTVWTHTPRGPFS